jgi:23S rRNA maturation-related 3'-5' exoribonuclease YhaM
MPKLKEIDINYDQIRELVCQLEFKKKMSLIQEIIKQKEYKNSFYTYTESLLKKYNIPTMDEDELDTFLH